MDQDKKQELAETDKRWKLEKTVQVPEVSHIEWADVKTQFNILQDNQGDLYITIAKLPIPTGIDKARLWIKNKRQDGKQVTFHHSQVYNFYLKLAYELDVSVGKAVYRLLYDSDNLRDYFDLGKTVNISMNNVDAMDTAENSNVSRDELEEFIEDD